MLTLKTLVFDSIDKYSDFQFLVVVVTALALRLRKT